MERYDALIVGAGPAGGAMAALLAQAGWSVAVVEKAGFPRRKVCGEFHSTTNAPVLERLGVAGAIGALAGPEVRRVGFFARDTALSAPMPAGRGNGRWGRALGREHLDTLLLRRAVELGATLLQPWSAAAIEQVGDDKVCVLRPAAGTGLMRIAARIVIAAHGSWETGGLATQPARGEARPGDLFGFKAHFTGSALEPDLMPLLVFPGGYGGMVTSDGGRVSLSCCVGRDRLERLRRDHPGLRAGDAVLAHIRATTKGVRRALGHAALDGPILGAGPIRPGIRPRARAGVFLIGNAAGEAHPIVAEGISMAVQSAWLLFETLQSHEPALCSARPEAALRAVARDYGRRWWWAFAPRIHAAAAFAQLALRAPFSGAMRRAVGLYPRALTAGAYLSGKTKAV